jgi:multiple sugar transport system substrate-binding protein
MKDGLEKKRGLRGMGKRQASSMLHLSRRSFLKSAGLAAVSATALGALAGCDVQGGIPSGTDEAVGLALNALYMNQAGYSDRVLKDIAARYTEGTGKEVAISYTFVKYDELHDKIVTSAAAANATYDVILLDLIWTAEFANKGYVIPLDDRLPAATQTDIAPAIMSAFIYDGKTWAFPFLANFQCFFYNADHLDQAGFSAPPATLEEWYDQMVAIKRAGIVTYPYIDAWNQKEGLVCNYVRTAAQYGGDLFDEAGQPIMHEGAGLAALRFMRRCIDDGLADPASTNSDEPGAMNAFVSGAVTFNTNWTFVRGNMLDPNISQIGDVARVGVLPPASGSDAPAGSVSGFQGLAVMANSQKQEQAWDFIKFATSAEIQSEHLESEFPVWTSVQKSDKLQAINSDADAYATNLANVHHRPRVPNYQQVSAIIQEEVHKCLLKQTEPEEATTMMVERISALAS